MAFKILTKEVADASKQFLKTGVMPDLNVSKEKSSMSSGEGGDFEGPVSSPITKAVAYHEKESVPESSPSPPDAKSSPPPAAKPKEKIPPTEEPPSERAEGQAPRIVKAKIGDSEVEVSEEKLEELKRDGVLDGKDEEDDRPEPDAELVKAAKFLHMKFQQIPGLREIVMKSIEEGRVPVPGPSRDEKGRFAEDGDDEIDMDDATKRAIERVVSNLDKKIAPVLKSIEDRNRADQEQSEKKSREDFVSKINSEIDAEMKAYPVLSRANYAKLARERVIDRLRDNPRADIRKLVMETATMLTDEKKAELKEKINQAGENKQFRTASGEGHSPTAGQKKPFTWDDFRKGKLKGEVNRILDEARRGD